VESRTLLALLSNAFGVSGFEDDARSVVRSYVEGYADEVRTDALGNLIATRRGREGFTLMLDAHLDEVGVIISHVEEDGFLRFMPIGGWDPRVLLAQAVTVRTRSGALVRGVIGAVPPHLLRPEDREKPVLLDSLYIDVAAPSAGAVAQRGIRIGDPAVPGHACEALGEEWILGKALDDRAGCAVLIKVLEAVAGERLDLTLVCNFAIGEETGLRGARTAAYQIRPDLALALEGTVAADTPGVLPQRQPTRTGGGPALTIADPTIIVRPHVVRALEQLAERHAIPYQFKRPMSGGTDAGAIHQSRGGVPTGVVSLPCRYIHSPIGMLRLDDFEHTVHLVTAFAREARGLVS